MMIMMMFMMAYFPFLLFLCYSLPSMLMYRWILGTPGMENAVRLQLCNRLSIYDLYVLLIGLLLLSEAGDGKYCFS